MVSSEPTWHVSRVQKRVSTFVNFKVQKVQKPELSGLTVNWVFLYALSAFRKHMTPLWRNFLQWLRPRGKCEDHFMQNRSNKPNFVDSWMDHSWKVRDNYIRPTSGAASLVTVDPLLCNLWRRTTVKDQWWGSDWGERMQHSTMSPASLVTLVPMFLNMWTWRENQNQWKEDREKRM